MIEAIDCFGKALSLSPGSLDLRMLLAYAQAAHGLKEEARRTVSAASGIPAMKPSEVRKLVNTACELGANDTALEAIERALTFNPNEPDLLANKGAVLHRMGDTERAERVLVDARRRWPGHVATLMNLGVLCADRGLALEALECYDALLEARPDHARAKANRGLLKLLRGDCRGWADYEARRSLDSHTVAVPSGVPAWDGRLPAGKTLLLWGEQGLGDQIMGVRFASTLSSLGAKVVVRCDEALVSIFARVDGVSAVTGKNATPRCDAHVPMFSVPALTGTQSNPGNHADTVTGSQYHGAPYIRPSVTGATPNGTASVGDRELTLGLVWAGSSAHGNDRNRSLPADFLASLLDIPNVRWRSLQMGPRTAELDSLSSQLRERIVDVSVGLGDFSDTARELGQVDALVSVDTSVAHLAGAMGVPTVLMLPYVSDWRWGESGSTTPWYDSVRLVRQQTGGDWASVISSAHSEISGINCRSSDEARQTFPSGALNTMV